MAFNNTQKYKFDIATFIGVVLTISFIAAAIILGGSPGAFINIPAICIVFGGTLTATLISFSLIEFLKSFKTIFKVFVDRKIDVQDTSRRLINLSVYSRKNGLLSLQKSIDSLDSKSFTYKCLQNVVDGVPTNEIRHIMNNEINIFKLHQETAVRILKRGGDIAPAMGLIGTLVGLVQMLGNLDDPSSLGPSMAVALLTTLYGALMANIIFLPLAYKLERNTQEAVLEKQIELEGSLSIGEQQNPRKLEALVNSLLPETKQVKVLN